MIVNNVVVTITRGAAEMKRSLVTHRKRRYGKLNVVESRVRLKRDVVRSAVLAKRVTVAVTIQTVRIRFRNVKS